MDNVLLDSYKPEKTFNTQLAKLAKTQIKIYKLYSK